VTRRTDLRSKCTRSAAPFELEEKLTLDTVPRFIEFLASQTTLRRGVVHRTQARPTCHSTATDSCRIPARRIAEAAFFPGISLLPDFAGGPVSETFGQRLRRLRDERGLSVVELASAVGASQGALRQLESGNIKTPSFLLGVRLAIQLNVDPHYLALGEGSSMTERLDVIERRLVKVEQRLASLPTTTRR
jgi:transcriptional regulator with XRE-family HTH domain